MTSGVHVADRDALMADGLWADADELAARPLRAAGS
jgi:hypothetical protein